MGMGMVGEEEKKTMRERNKTGEEERRRTPEMSKVSNTSIDQVK